MAPPLNIYVIYTSEDTDVMLSLGQHLNQLKEFHTISIWQDDPILQGQYWIPRDETRLGETDIFLLLISDAFMHSEFIHQLEFKMVIDRYKEDKSVVIPIIVDNCPWDIDFSSEDYNFNFNELEVLPSGGKPIAEWKLSDQILEKITASVGSVISSMEHDHKQMKSENDSQESSISGVGVENIDQEASVENGNKDDHGDKESLRVAVKNHLQEEAEVDRSNNKRPHSAEPEIETTGEEVKISKDIPTSGVGRKAYGTIRNMNSRLKKSLLLLASVILFAFVGAWLLMNNTASSHEETPIFLDGENTKDEKLIDVNDSVSADSTEISTSIEEISLSRLAVGDPYDGGTIFSIDGDGKTGKVAHHKDAGPMPWKTAMNIHLQLGEGWRLPTLDELKLMRQTIGQGTSNSGQFTRELYWSSTLYDDYQAQLLRFSDGNASYHYNMENEDRIFMVRAVRDFSR